MKKIRTAIFLFIISLILPGMSFAGIRFDNLTINSSDTILYTVTCNVSGAKPYATLFSYRLSGEQSINGANLPDILTCFPENLSSFNNGNTLQVRNRFGTALYDFEQNTLTWVARSAIIPEKSFSLSPIMTSPDGKWCVFMRKVSASTGELIIQNVETKKYVIIDKEAFYSCSTVPVKWSFDSKNCVYEKNGSIYFCNPENMFKGLQIEEKYRRVGKGKIGAVQWCDGNKLVFIDSDIVYLIDSRELNSLGMYANVYTLGKIIGRLPEKFVPETMEFTADFYAQEMILIKDNNFISYFKFDNSKPQSYVKLLNYKSYADIFDSSFKFDILWPKNSKPVIWTDLISDSGKRSSEVYIFTEKNDMVKILTIENSSSNAAVSTDGKYIAFSSGDVAYVYSVNPWKRVGEVKGEKVHSLCWKSSDKLCVGGEKTVKLFDLVTGVDSVLFLSECNKVTWDESTGKVIARVDGYSEYFLYDEKTNTWSKAQNVTALPVTVQSKNYRVYTAKAKNENFENGIYVRTLSSKTNTFALYKDVLQKANAKKRISIVFDLADSAEGVNEILALCEHYNLTTTFFINGEFIRRYPAETIRIAQSGAEVGSMFHTYMDLTGKDFDVTDDFITRGLARNEDEYFKCTNKELALMWHAPFYKSTKAIRDAGRSAGYNYIDFPTELEKMDSKAGKTLESQIIPISVNTNAEGGRTKFYDKLELLINTLLDAGYEIVPVSAL
ncbi:polysaccharide deacetylase family protein [Treponema sp.]|uniref:polysaccharide deacetylase family protein n=1 Tax=Treponema sp. TaxID=166 RepID=UPI00298D9BC3|nr:polysaccharide deacetylase family protein [Treponema sp.]MCR5612221.1 polysaccharide deacetylase family protein [Treponema sp.]